MSRIIEIIGTGSCLGENILTNYDLWEMPGISEQFDEKAARESKIPGAKTLHIENLFDAWTQSVTGIESRGHTDKTAEELATIASSRAAEDARIELSEIQAVYGASTSPYKIIPNFAISVADHLKLYDTSGRLKRGVPCFALNSACAGFVAAFSGAYNSMRVGDYDTVLVFGSETLSKVFDPRQLKSYVLAGDGAGAFILRARETEPDEDPNKGVLGRVFMGHAISDSLLQDNANIPNTLAELSDSNGGIDTRFSVMMGGESQNTRRILKDAVNYFRLSIEEAYKTLPPEFYDPREPLLPQMQKHIKLINPHTANDRIHVKLEEKMEIPVARMIRIIGNTSCASIPIAEDQIRHQSTEDAQRYPANPGDLVAGPALGGGYGYGCFFNRR